MFWPLKGAHLLSCAYTNTLFLIALQYWSDCRGQNHHRESFPSCPGFEGGERIICKVANSLHIQLSVETGSIPHF